MKRVELIAVLLLVSSVGSAAQRCSEVTNVRVANTIAHAFRKKGAVVNPGVIAVVLRSADVSLAKYFPHGPYTRRDLLAMAWLESSFNKYEKGTHGERGVFQIMPDEFGKRKPSFDISLNTDLACRVLASKYRRHHDYKRALIAYNGYVMRNGHLDETYWRLFAKRRQALSKILQG
jgi:hypothetical protein